MLVDDLREIYYDFMKGSEKIKVASKADIDAIIERSPDVGDAFMHTFAIPLDQMSFGMNQESKVIRQQYADSQYDPFEQRGYMQ
jgi:hypothetical protein